MHGCRQRNWSRVALQRSLELQHKSIGKPWANNTVLQRPRQMQTPLDFVCSEMKQKFTKIISTWLCSGHQSSHLSGQMSRRAAFWFACFPCICMPWMAKLIWRYKKRWNTFVPHWTHGKITLLEAYMPGLSLWKEIGSGWCNVWTWKESRPKTIFVSCATAQKAWQCQQQICLKMQNGADL